jgi:hypothetical protein
MAGTMPIMRPRVDLLAVYAPMTQPNEFVFLGGR